MLRFSGKYRNLHYKNTVHTAPPESLLVQLLNPICRANLPNVSLWKIGKWPSVTKQAIALGTFSQAYLRSISNKSSKIYCKE